MAASVFDSTQSWGGSDRGIALYGTCSDTEGEAAHTAERVYGARFEAYSKWRAGLGTADQAGGWRFFRFSTKRVKVFDEARLGAAVFAIASVRRAKVMEVYDAAKGLRRTGIIPV